MEVVFSRAAIREAREARIWFRDRDPRTVAGFRQRLRQAREQLAEFPHSGRRFAHGTRALSLSPYPYYRVYRVRADVAEILALVHTRQGAAFWRDR